MKNAASVKTVLAVVMMTSFGATAVAQEAVPAPAGAPADSGFQVVRPGDSQMSCEALIAEANALNAQMAAQQSALTERAMESSRGIMRAQQVQSGVSTALSVGSMIGAMIPGVALALDAAQSVAGMAQQATAAAQRQQMMNDMDQMMTDAQASGRDLMPLMNRADHLTDLSMAKGC
ncbi:hypothetical protein ASD25_06885 [Brevundimonas sp. Root1423]|nr:hypothetical protein ASD25_06885 [Brevundimonas sp. Root1423]